jgi:hypothetical protein
VAIDATGSPAANSWRSRAQHPLDARRYSGKLELRLGLRLDRLQRRVGSAGTDAGDAYTFSPTALPSSSSAREERRRRGVTIRAPARSGSSTYSASEVPKRRPCATTWLMLTEPDRRCG